MMSSMEAARRVKAAAAVLERAKQVTKDAAVAIAEAAVAGDLTAVEKQAYTLAKQAEFQARWDYFTAVEARLQVADYRKARIEQQRGAS